MTTRDENSNVLLAFLICMYKHSIQLYKICYFLITKKLPHFYPLRIALVRYNMRGLTSLSTTKCTRDCGSERATSFMNTIVISIISCSTHGSISAVFPITVGNSPEKDFGRVNADSFPEQRLVMEHTCFIIPFLVIFLRDLFYEITRCNLYSLRKQRIIYVVRK